MNQKEPLLQREGTKSVLASLISILIGLAFGAVVILFVGLTSKDLGGASAWEGIRLIFGGLFSTGRGATGALTWGFNGQNIGNMLFRATPLIMTGLSVAMAYKTGLFNIGAPGQYLMGTLVSLSIALGIPSGSLPKGLIWLLAFLGALAAGALWGAIPGALKAFLNINEVIACIMTNWIAANFVTWMFSVSNFKNVVENTKSSYIYKTTYGLVNGTYVPGAGVATAKMGLDKIFPGSQINGGILIAILFAVGVYVMMEKTTFGYELKACGLSKTAAKYAGINEKRNIILSMTIAGALAGLGGALYYLSGSPQWNPQDSTALPAMGFDGISVALLASSSPIGSIFSALFISHISIGGTFMEPKAFPMEVANIISGVIIYLCAFMMLFKNRIAKLFTPKEKGGAK